MVLGYTVCDVEVSYPGLFPYPGLSKHTGLFPYPGFPQKFIQYLMLGLPYCGLFTFLGLSTFHVI